MNVNDTVCIRVLVGWSASEMLMHSPLHSLSFLIRFLNFSNENFIFHAEKWYGYAWNEISTVRWPFFFRWPLAITDLSTQNRTALHLYKDFYRINLTERSIFVSFSSEPYVLFNFLSLSLLFSFSLSPSHSLRNRHRSLSAPSKMQRTQSNIIALSDSELQKARNKNEREKKKTNLDKLLIK